MAEDNNAMAEEPTAEIKDASIDESKEWDFHATIKVVFDNPHGEDFVGVKSCKARPKHDDLTSTPSDVHVDTTWWFADDYPAHGDRPFAEGHVNWRPTADINDDDSLLSECKESATFDPAAEYESLVQRVGRRSSDRLGGTQ